MPNQTTPPWNSVDDAIRLSHLLRPGWDERQARIPAWHPRNEETPEERAAREAAEAQQQIDWESDENPYRKRYTDTQSEYTRNQQRLRELEQYEQSSQAYLELGKQKGWIEIEDPNAGGGQQEQDPYAERVAALEARQAQIDARIAQENAAAGEQAFYEDIDAWAKEAGTTLSQADRNAMLWLVVNSPNPEEEATARRIFDAHVAQKKSEREAWESEYEEARKRPRVPHVPTNGGTETGVVDYSKMTDREADQYMAEQLRAARQR